MPSHPLRTLASATSAVALVVGGIAVTTSAAHAAPGDDAACPLPYDDTFTDGQAVNGLTTTRGTTPEAFTGSYVDTIPNGIGRGRDLLIFELEGSRITKPDGTLDAGVWAGISGSPVYDEATGKLVGAVSYGRSEANEVQAGITPAKYMYDELLPSAPAPPVAPATVRLPAATRKALEADGKEASVGVPLRRLSSARYIGGASTKAAEKIGAKAGLKNTTFLAGAPAASAGPTLPIVPGGNVAASWSYGDITAASIGSVTAVCGEDVLAFGHPDAHDGDSTQSIHGARALGINASGGFGSFKDVAEIGAPVGSLLQDRLEGISGKLGPLPVSVDLTSTTSAPRNPSLSGQTTITQMSQLPYIVALQTSSDTTTALNAGTSDDSVGGESLIRWAITYENEAGATKTFERSQRYSGRSGLAYDVTSDVVSDVQTLQDNPFEDVKISKIAITNALANDYRAYKIAKVEYRTSKGWNALRSGRKVNVRKGYKLILRISLDKADRYSTVTPKAVQVTYPVSKHAYGTGQLLVDGNMFSFDDFEEYEDISEEYFEDDEENPFEQPVAEPRNLDQLLAQLRAVPRQDDATSSLGYLHQLNGVHIQSRKIRMPAVVTGSFYVPLGFKK